MQIVGVQQPSPGRIVWYQTDGRGGGDYFLPAMVTVTVDNQWVEGLERAGIPVLDDPMRVHLSVFSPGVDYVEHNVAYSPSAQPRSWRWPGT